MYLATRVSRRDLKTSLKDFTTKTQFRLATKTYMVTLIEVMNFICATKSNWIQLLLIFSFSFLQTIALAQKYEELPKTNEKFSFLWNWGGVKEFDSTDRKKAGEYQKKEARNARLLKIPQQKSDTIFVTWKDSGKYVSPIELRFSNNAELPLPKGVENLKFFVFAAKAPGELPQSGGALILNIRGFVETDNAESQKNEDDVRIDLERKSHPIFLWKKRHFDRFAYNKYHSTSARGAPVVANTDLDSRFHLEAGRPGKQFFTSDRRSNYQTAKNPSWTWEKFYNLRYERIASGSWFEFDLKNVRRWSSISVSAKRSCDDILSPRILGNMKLRFTYP